MAIPFSRSMRSLYVDGSGSALTWLIVAIVLLGAWAAWFFLARMTLYETGQIVRTTREGTVVAHFPLTAAARIRRGQSALLHPQGIMGMVSAPLPAIVTDVRESPREEQLRVELYPQTRTVVFRPQQQGVTGLVAVEVAHVSPAALLLRVAGSSRTPSPTSLNPSTR